VVVTGASGFIARAVVPLLRATGGVSVVPVSRRRVPGGTQVSSYEEAPAGDVLIHLAEDNDRARVSQAPPEYARQVRATLAALRRKGYSRVVYASSGVLYGDRRAHAHDVDDEIVASDAYAALKRDCELEILGWSGGVVARLSNVYGPAMAEGNVVSTIVRQIPGHGPLRVSDTRPIRDFLWVDDAARGLTAMALGRPAGDVFNLATGIGTSVGDIAVAALAAAGERTRPVAGANEGRCASVMILNPAGTARTYGWRAEVTVTLGLSMLVQQRAQQP
jgi:nucleoside-diphosphate-sugar epimerase